jgi:hypothetical protein
LHTTKSSPCRRNFWESSTSSAVFPPKKCWWRLCELQSGTCIGSQGFQGVAGLSTSLCDDCLMILACRPSLAAHSLLCALFTPCTYPPTPPPPCTWSAILMHWSVTQSAKPSLSENCRTCSWLAISMTLGSAGKLGWLWYQPTTCMPYSSLITSVT